MLILEVGWSFEDQWYILGLEARRLLRLQPMMIDMGPFKSYLSVQYSINANFSQQIAILYALFAITCIIKFGRRVIVL